MIVASRLSTALVLAVACLPACNPRDGGTASSTAPVSSTPAGVRPDQGGMPEPVLVPAVERACKSAPCSGAHARVVVLRKDNRIVRYLHHGDPSSCSHPPSVYFDRDGSEVGAIPMVPITPGSEKEKELDEKRRGLEAGGTPVEEIDCTGRVTGKAK